MECDWEGTPQGSSQGWKYFIIGLGGDYILGGDLPYNYVIIYICVLVPYCSTTNYHKSCSFTYKFILKVLEVMSNHCVIHLKLI